MEDQTIEEIKPIENPTYSVLVYPAADMPEQYRPMIMSRWLRSLRFGNPVFRKADSDTYYKHYNDFICNLMKKPDSKVRLAVLSDDHDVALGFSVSREDVLDYIHVQNDYRRIGIARKLLPEGLTTFSHITLTGTDIWPKNPNYKHLKFNPFA